MTAGRPLKIGFIPLVDAASLFIAVDKGFAAEEGLAIELVREVSWSNIRDRLAIGDYDAAHLLAPMAIASSLGLSHVKVPLVAAFNLAMNGNAITVSPELYARLGELAGDGLSDPTATARALRKIIRERDARGEEPLTFGMTFPFSTHNYQLRYWLAEGGVDPDRDLRLVVLPPPYMVDNLAKRQVDGFCVGAPWNAVAAETGVGVVLHPGCRIFSPSPEKTLALSLSLVEREPRLAVALVRACLRGAAFVADEENRDEVVAVLARRDRVGVGAQALRRALDGSLIATGALNREFLLFGDRSTGRPDPYQAAWLYAQMLRWGQARLFPESASAARAVFDARIFDSAAGVGQPPQPAPIRAFSGADFSADSVETYLGAFEIGAKP